MTYKWGLAIPAGGSLVTSLTLLERAKQQDSTAWRRLCEIYAPLVYGWARKAGIAEQDAPDVVQEVFRIVASTLPRFRHDRPGDTFRGWLITITQTEVRGFFRRQGKLASRGEGGSTAAYRLQQVAQDGSDSDLRTDPREDRNLILRRAAELVKNDFALNTWQAFWRSVVENDPPDAIAAALNMSPNAIRQARFRVLARLRETLSESEFFGPSDQLHS